jgi:hypothetical protein
VSRGSLLKLYVLSATHGALGQFAVVLVVAMLKVVVVTP